MVRIVETTEDTAEIIVHVARRQKALIKLLLVYCLVYALLITIFIQIMKKSEIIGVICVMVFLVVFHVIYFIHVFRLAKSIGSNPWLYILLILLGGILAIIAILMLNGKATRFLKRHEIRVGIMGAKNEDMRQYYEMLSVVESGEKERSPKITPQKE